jgi:hypothetical protein
VNSFGSFAAVVFIARNMRSAALLTVSQIFRKTNCEYYRILEHDDYQTTRVRQTKSRADVNMRHLNHFVCCTILMAGWFDVHPIVTKLLEDWEADVWKHI